MQNRYPYQSKYSLFNTGSLDEDKAKHNEFLSALESDFSYLEINAVPDSVKPLKKKVEEIAGREILEERTSKYQLQQCMHLVHMMNMVSKVWSQSAAWWHTPFSLDKSKPLATIEDYRHDEVIYRDLFSFREMLNYRINIFPQMFELERLVMDFMVYFPRSMYDFHDSNIKMYAGQYEAATILTHLIHQLNFEHREKYDVNGFDEFCKQALINEAIKHANYFVKECDDFFEYDFEIADIDYGKLFDSECGHYDDNTLIKIVCEKFNHTLRDNDYTRISSLIDVIIFMKHYDRKQPLYNGSTEQAFSESRSEPYIRFAAICFLIKADRDKLRFNSKKTGAGNKKIHIIKELTLISRKLSSEDNFEDKISRMSDIDYSFLKFIAYGLSAITTAIEYGNPTKEGIDEYKKVRRLKWNLIAMVYSTIGHLPLGNLKDYLSILTRNLLKFIKSSEMMGVLKQNSREEYLRMKETGELDKL